MEYKGPNSLWALWMWPSFHRIQSAYSRRFVKVEKLIKHEDEYIMMKYIYFTKKGYAYWASFPPAANISFNNVTSLSERDEDDKNVL